MRNIVSPLDGFASPFGRRSGNPFASLMSQLLSGASQLIAHPLEYGSMFQDRAGTTPVTAPGQLVGHCLDAGGGDYHATAISDAARGVFREATVRGIDLVPDYWIDATNGSDANDGLTEGTAWATLKKAADTVYGVAKAGNVVVRVKSDTYDSTLDYFNITSAFAPVNDGLVLVFEPDCVMDGTAANGVSPQNGFEFSTDSWLTTIYGNGLLIQDYLLSSANGVGNRGSHSLHVYDVTVDNCDDGLSGHGNSTIYAYDCTFRNCVKSAYAHVDNTTTFHYRCRFEGRASALLGIGANQSTNTATFEDCEFIPISSTQVLGLDKTTLRRCQLGTTSARTGGSRSTGLVVEDSFVNYAADTDETMSFTRCYGFLSLRQRIGGILTMEDCVISGPATGVPNIFYSNFDSGGGSPHLIRNNIFETLSAAEFMSYDATNAGYLVAAGSEFFNNIISGSAAFDADLIAADTGGTVIVDNVTGDALIGPANTLNPDDYGYTAGSPAIGAATDGGNSGFAVGEVASPVPLGTGRPVIPYIEYNGVNTAYATPALPAPLVDKAQVFAGVRKLSDAAQGIVSEFSPSIATNNGAFALSAPNSAADNLAFESKGTTLQSAVASGYVSPITKVLTGLGDISGDLATLRIDGTQVAQSTADQGTSNYNPSGTDPLYYGARDGTSLFFNGRHYDTLGPITRFSAANATTEQIEAAEAYYTARVI